ncbi:hypothetical protein D3C72_2384730 [compost metagenome]
MHVVSCRAKRLSKMRSIASWVSSAEPKTASVGSTTWKPWSIAPITVVATQTSVSPPVTMTVSTLSDRSVAMRSGANQGE